MLNYLLINIEFMNKHFKKIIGYVLGILFIIFLIFLPTILIQSTVKSVNLAVKLKNDVTKKKTGQPPIASIEPIEKVGFFHFLPGMTDYYLEAIDLDLGTQTASSAGEYLRPENQVIADAKSAGANIISLASSDLKNINDYNLSLAKLARQNNFHTTLSFNSCLDLQTLKNILPSLDAVKIDIDDSENGYCAPNSNNNLSALQAEIKAVKAANVHLEIFSQLDYSNSTTSKINDFINLVSGSLGDNAIIHFIAADGATDASTTTSIIAAREQALRAGFKYVYTGGFDYPQGESTYCADGTAALSRQDDFLLQDNLTAGKCADGTAIPGVWK
jgi:pyruvate formate lyase activating enzyme